MPIPPPSRVFANANRAHTICRLGDVPNLGAFALGRWLGIVNDIVPPRRDFTVVEWEDAEDCDDFGARPLILGSSIIVVVPHRAALRGIR